MNDVAEEIWKDIGGYEWYYQISNKGRVKSLSRQREGNGKKGLLAERILKLTINSDGYYNVKLYKNGKKKSFKVHRLLAIAFLENPKGEKYINHKDGNKTNNSLDNIEWCTSSHNVKHAYKMGLNPVCLNLDKEKLEKLYIKKNKSVKEIAATANCSITSVRNYLKKYNIKKEAI